jgi:formate dehydrogenase subunit gamma
LSGRVLSVSALMRSSAAERDEILRFRKSERQLHWAIGVPFMVCYTTAMVLITVYNPHPGRPFREVVSWIHRLSGVCLIVLPTWTIARHWRDFRIHLYNMRQAWGWTFNDVKWLLLMGPSTVSKKVTLPDQGKFNAAEKINFMMLMSTYPVYICTGILIWLPGVAYLSWLIHFGMALIATGLMAGHIFMATVNPDTRVGLSGMVSGFVDRHWAKHHYRLWYDEHFENVEVIGEPVAEVAADTSTEREQPAGLWPHPRGHETLSGIGPRGLAPAQRLRT